MLFCSAASAAQRVVSLAPSLTQIVVELGAQQRLVGMLDAGPRPAGLAQVASVGHYGQLNSEALLALKPDVLFLDIKMPGQTGLEAAEELAERWEGPEPFPQVVFVTAYDEYA
ncbi:ABC transporter substrate-binding protein, partial [Pseudomonas sp.]|uniref:ABC transporter substrate-binding protein n=1 Tax=Pseudomonas sp. TaxID=306 RepID=UPI0025887AF9